MFTLKSMTTKFLQYQNTNKNNKKQKRFQMSHTSTVIRILNHIFQHLPICNHSVGIKVHANSILQFQIT